MTESRMPGDDAAGVVVAVTDVYFADFHFAFVAIDHEEARPWQEGAGVHDAALTPLPDSGPVGMPEQDGACCGAILAGEGGGQIG